MSHLLGTLLAQVAPYTANLDITTTGGLLALLTMHWHTWRQTVALKRHAETTVVGVATAVVKKHEGKHHGLLADDAERDEGAPHADQ